MGYVYIILGAALAFAVLWRAGSPRTSSTGPFPRGPPTIPLLGNLHQIPRSKSFVTFAEWGRTHTPDGLLGLRLGPSARLLVLNKWQHVRDLLDARGSIYSDRPAYPAAEAVLPGDVHLVFMKYGPQWRKTRRTISEFLKESEVEKLLPVQDAESSQMIYDLLTDTAEKGKYRGHAMRFFGAVILATVFGQRGKTYGPESIVRRFFSVQDEWAGILDQGAVPPYDVLPFLRYVPDFLTPWRGWRERAEDLKARQSSLYRELFEGASRRVAAGKSRESFIGRIIRDQADQGDQYSQLELDYIGGFYMEGGADTTAVTFLTFVLAMAAHPAILAQVQEEVDRVFGSDKMPHPVEEGRLPFLRACILETLRWRPGFPVAIPHATSQDDTYQGYFIPKGTTVLLNTWAVNHDADEFADPDVFNPSRYLANRYGTKGDAGAAQEAADNGGASRKQSYAFGAGRRLCAGQRMAENSLMLTTSKLAWAFDIVPENGRPDTDVRTAFHDAILTGPKQFDVQFRARDGRKVQVIRAEFAKADAFLSRYE